MNFLAHLVLADETPASVVGNILADFLRGAAVGRQPAEIVAAIRVHQAVDRFTDGHRVVRRAKGRISAGRRRFAGVLVDIFFDHFLARDFGKYHATPLPVFAGGVYGMLRGNQQLVPGEMREGMEAMIGQEWLTTYATVEGIDLTLRRMSGRLKRETGLGSGVEELVGNYRELEGDLRGFGRRWWGMCAEHHGAPWGKGR